MQLMLLNVGVDNSW